MLATKAIRQALGDLLAADTATLAPAANACKASLVTNVFTPSEGLTVGDFTVATFTGSAAKSAGLGTQTTGFDPATGQQIITIKDPAGGWTWVCTVAPGAPEIITGLIFTDNGIAALYGMMLFDTPVSVAGVGDQVSVGALTFTLPFSPLT